MEPMRLQKFMALAGAGARRKCEEWIAQGLVAVNGEVVTAMGVKIDPSKDQVTLKGKPLKLEVNKTTVLLHKPAGYVTTSHDQYGRPNVTQLIDLPGVRLFPVGRLDYQTTGAILLTNDGDLAYQLTHPSHHIPKVYKALMKGKVVSQDIEKLKKGVVLDDGYKTQPARARLLGIAGSNSKVEITIFEGKNHQVRRMARAVGHPVLKLHRESIGTVELGNLPEGHFRKLTPQELRSLKDLLRERK